MGFPYISNGLPRVAAWTCVLAIVFGSLSACPSAAFTDFSRQTTRRIDDEQGSPSLHMQGACTASQSWLVMQGLFDSIPEKLFRSDISSTELRNKGAGLG